MELIDKTGDYIKSTLDISISFAHFSGDLLPLYLQSAFAYQQAELLGLPCLLLSVLDPDIEPSVLEKYCRNIQKYYPEFEPIVIFKALSAHNRKRLIERKISFIVPNNQLYIPTVGLDLREYFKRIREQQAVVKLSPTSQLLMLWTLLKTSINGINSAQMAEQLKVSRMSVARAYDELESFEWIQMAQLRGNQKAVELAIGGKELWLEVKTHLKSPVRKVRFVQGNVGSALACDAGETALARYTLLNEPSIPVKAIKAEEWQGIQKMFQLEELSRPEPGAICLQTWRYAPELFSNDGSVDRLSLYLSLQKNDDPRVRIALGELEESMPW